MNNKNFQLIYLNGPSSSDKTNLAKALQQALEPQFLHIRIDKIIGWIPEKINNRTEGKHSLEITIQERQIDPFARKLGKTFQEVILTLAQLGHYIIIDDVSFGKNQVDSWKELLKHFPVLWIGIRTPPSVLEQQEVIHSNRIIDSTGEQFYEDHIDVSYDLEIDTHQCSLDEAVEQIQSFISPCHPVPLQHISHVGVYGVIEEEGKLLLVTKEKGAYIGRLDFPGGKIEFGEDIAQALHREFLEEVGMDFDSMSYIGNFSTCFDVPNEDQPYRLHHMGLIYAVSGLRKDQTNQNTLMKYDWIDISTLSQDMVCPFVWQVIKEQMQ